MIKGSWYPGGFGKAPVFQRVWDKPNEDSSQAHPWSFLELQWSEVCQDYHTSSSGAWTFTLANIAPTHLLSDMDGQQFLMRSREIQDSVTGLGCGTSCPATWAIKSRNLWWEKLCGFYGTFLSENHIRHLGFWSKAVASAVETQT